MLALCQKEAHRQRLAVFSPSTRVTSALTSVGFSDTNSKQHRALHRRIKHSSGLYVKGDIHTTTVEGLWSLIKNGIRGVYHSVSPDYLQTYLDEFTFRYNRRHDGNQQFRAI